jgi:hypothetical protein
MIGPFTGTTSESGVAFEIPATATSFVSGTNYSFYEEIKLAEGVRVYRFQRQSVVRDRIIP